MKYRIMFLVLSSFIFLGCFEKKPDEELISWSGGMLIDETKTIWSGTEVSETGSLENIPEVQNTQTGTSEVSSGTQEISSSSGSSGNEQEVIEEYEDDLEALFNDILKSE